MQGYHAPQSPPPAPDPIRTAAWDGYISLITTILPSLRSGREANPRELAAAWRQLTAAVETTGSGELKRLCEALPQQPAAADLDPIKAELARLAGVSRA